MSDYRFDFDDKTLTITSGELGGFKRFLKKYGIEYAESNILEGVISFFQGNNINRSLYVCDLKRILVSNIDWPKFVDADPDNSILAALISREMTDDAFVALGRLNHLSHTARELHFYW